jgi:hypothetical protein
MNGDEFYEGQQVKKLWWPDESCHGIDNSDCDKITVVMENGQMAGVPWFAVWKDGIITTKHNAVHIASVELL